MNRVKSTLSEKNPLRLSKHRYYELRHWCLQYPEWKAKLQNMELLKAKAILTIKETDGTIQRPTEETAERAERLHGCIHLVDRISEEAGKEISKWLRIGVTEDRSFTELKMLYQIPCERDMYYRRYRLFFARLSEEKPE